MSDGLTLKSFISLKRLKYLLMRVALVLDNGIEKEQKKKKKIRSSIPLTEILRNEQTETQIHMHL